MGLSFSSFVSQYINGCTVISAARVVELQSHCGKCGEFGLCRGTAFHVPGHKLAP